MNGLGACKRHNLHNRSRGMIAQSVAEIVSRHVKLTVDGIDRMYLNLFVPDLQYEPGIVRFFREHRGQPLPSAALMSPMSRGFVAELEAFAVRHGIALVQFSPGQRKDDVMAEHLRHFTREEGVVFIGKAQEKTPVFRTERRRSPTTGRPYPWIVRRSAMVNNYYIYAVDRDFGPFFLKFCSYFPFNAKLCLNGHEYAKRQLTQQGIAFEALDNGILSCADPKRLQTICDRLSAEKIDALLRKWLRLLPHPFTANDRKAGYRYAISILQAEFSTTQVLDRPVHGRLFFEEVIRENLDLGRPEKIQLIFNRRIPRSTSARFRTRVVTQDVTPSLHVYYKNTRIKQYHKENRALRTETTINNTYDFSVGRRLHNLPKLRAIGFAANRRLLEIERLSHDCVLSEDAFQTINSPIVSGRQRASGLRFADPRVHALLHALILFRQLAKGFRAADLRQHLAALSAHHPATISQGAITYQLRRLRLHGLIERTPKSFRYQVTDLGLRVALFFTRIYNRLLRPSLAAAFPQLRAIPTALKRAFDALVAEIDTVVDQTHLAAQNLTPLRKSSFVKHG
jgi:DNA-binding PadR family transcriptional regulator